MNLRVREDDMKTKERVFYYLKSQRLLLSVSIIFALIFVISQIAQPFLLGLTLDYAKTDNEQAFYLCLFISLGLVIFGTITDYFFEYLVGKISQRIIKKMRDDVYKKLNSIPLKEFDNRYRGDLLQLEIRDMESVATGIFAVFKSFLQGIFTIIITIIVMFMVNWILALGVIILTPLSVIMSSFIATFNHQHFKKQAELQAKLNSISLETSENMDIVQSLNYQKESYQKFMSINDELKKENKVSLFSASWINPSTRLVNNTIYVIIGIIGIIMLSYDTDLMLILAVMTIGKLSSFLSYTTQYSKPFNEISNVFSEYENAKFSFRRINELLSINDDIDQGKETLDHIETISFKDLSFSYNPNKELIKNFSLEIKKGNKIAIVGPTGAGKTTLINLLMRFYEPQNGELLINQKPITSFTKSSLRNNIGMVLQDTWIFDGSILDNIKYTKANATIKEIQEAIKNSHMDSFIDSLPDGINTVVKAKEGLSEGQRQMIAIARVMLLSPNIIILDEATSNIDTRNEKLINDAFDKMMKDKTSIVIAHRLSTIQEADIILVLKDGQIIESGNHHNLMNNKGFYYEMYSSQFK